jgi:anti-sigma-K factor RskA
MNGDAGDPRRKGTPQGPSVPDELLADFILGTLDANEATRVAEAVAADAAVARRAAGFRQALDALAVDLAPAEPPTTGLERLLQAAREENPGEADPASRQGAAADGSTRVPGVRPPVRAAARAAAARAGAPESASVSTSSRSSTATPPAVPHARRPSPAGLHGLRRGAKVVAGVLVVALVALASAFATFQAAAVAEVREEQRVLAYWMANPDMTLISLEAPTPGGTPTDQGGAASGGSDAWDGIDAAWAEGDAASEAEDTGHLGVVCLLPDGRGLVLRPYPAPRGAWYQVVGTGPEGELELARSGGNVLTFDARGIERLEVRVLDARRSGLAGVLDRGASLLGRQPAATPDGIGDGMVVAQVRLP